LTIDLVNPCGIYPRIDRPLAPRRAWAEIRTIGLFSNQKANADLFLDNVERVLKQRHAHLEFTRFSKIASVPARFSEEFLSRCHAVVAAFGD
jgi:hypothetical protein